MAAEGADTARERKICTNQLRKKAYRTAVCTAVVKTESQKSGLFVLTFSQGKAALVVVAIQIMM